jgi:hypothetical protein
MKHRVSYSQPKTPTQRKLCSGGKFNPPEKRPVQPIFVKSANGDNYSPAFMATGGKSERTKEIRSTTPIGFSRAFFEANP